MNNETDRKNYQSAESTHGKASFSAGDGAFFSWRGAAFSCVLYQVIRLAGSHGTNLLEPAALCRAPAPLPAACFKVGNGLARSHSVKFR